MEVWLLIMHKAWQGAAYIQPDISSNEIVVQREKMFFCLRPAFEWKSLHGILNEFYF